MNVWNSRRTSVASCKGICTSSQPLASAVGVKILNQGGNAADAAVAMAAALNMTEPCSTGIGGDAFMLYYDASTRKVSCLQGNGATSSRLSLDYLHALGIGATRDGYRPWDPRSGLCVTVPGAALLWDDTIQRFGRLSLSQVLQPAIELGEEGFPIHACTADQWSRGVLQGEEANRVFRPLHGRPPQANEVFTNKDLANTFRRVGTYGAKQGFYRGEIAARIEEAVREFGGVLDLQDLSGHETADEPPISHVFRDIRVYQTPPPSHGVAVLLALAMLEKLLTKMGIDKDNCRGRGDEYEAHLMIECMRLSFADALEYVSDPRTTTVPTELLLSDAFVSSRVDLISDRAICNLTCGDLTPFATSDTVYFCCADREGNACSFINSNYMGFGTGIVPKGCGFTLHNRGYNFNLLPEHVNCVGPSKRPYHTIIPGLSTYEDDQSLHAVFGNMGGFMQPMGHIQLLRNLIDYHMDPQSSVDAPRWYLKPTGLSQTSGDMRMSSVQLEYGYGGSQDGGEDCGDDQGQRVASSLRLRGHEVDELVCGDARTLYGRAQVILRHRPSNVFIAGSDPRADGCAIPQV